MPPAAPPAKLYVVSVFLMGGPVSKKFANKEISRVIEIRGDQTLEATASRHLQGVRPFGRTHV